MWTQDQIIGGILFLAAAVILGLWLGAVTVSPRGRMPESRQPRYFSSLGFLASELGWAKSYMGHLSHSLFPELTVWRLMKSLEHQHQCHSNQYPPEKSPGGLDVTELNCDSETRPERMGHP